MPIKLKGSSSGDITLDVPATAGTNTLTLPAVTDTLTGIAATQTLTNKTLTSPVISGPSISGDLNYTGTLTGGTGVVNIGSGQVYKDASGNVGIGTTSPAYKLDVNNASASEIGRFVNGAGRGNVRFDGYNDVTLQFYRRGASVGIIQTDNSGNELLTGTTGAYPLTYYTNNTERMRIDSSGNLLVGTTSLPSGGGGGLGISASGFINTSRTTTSTAAHHQFYNPNGNVGAISTVGTATSYNTASDYRLKEDIAPMTGALSVVAALKPVTYKWKVDGSDGQGFIAHELAEVCPDAVTGEKDAVDAEGNPKYQGVDTSFLVATLTAAIQELNAKFEEYKAAHP